MDPFKWVWGPSPQKNVEDMLSTLAQNASPSSVQAFVRNPKPFYQTLTKSFSTCFSRISIKTTAWRICLTPPPQHQFYYIFVQISRTIFLKSGGADPPFPPLGYATESKIRYSIEDINLQYIRVKWTFSNILRMKSLTVLQHCNSIVCPIVVSVLWKRQR